MADVLSVIVVHYNTPELLRVCLGSLAQYLTGLEFECIVVDNASSTPGVAEVVGAHAFARLLQLPENVGFGRANNAGAAEARGDVLLLLNPDTELIDTSVAEAAGAFGEQMPHEIWGLGLRWADGSFQNSFSTEIGYREYLYAYSPLGRLARGVVARHKYGNTEPVQPLEVGVVYATAMLVRAADFTALGGFDPAYFLYFEDIDLCDRFRAAGGRVVQHPEARLIHHVRASTGGAWSPPSAAYLASKYLYGKRRFGSLAVWPVRIADSFASAVRGISAPSN